MVLFYTFIFSVCCILLYFSGEWVVGGLMRIARYLSLREFVVAFIVMAFAASLPNLFVGISSALHDIPELSLGDIIGGNVIDLTLAIALALLFTKEKIPAESRTVQFSSLFTIISAILPLLLVMDGEMSRGDGIILIMVFFLYLYWLFSKKERFTKVYDSSKVKTSIKAFKTFVMALGKVVLGIALLLIAAEGIINSASFFAARFNLPLEFIGILFVGLGNALPEIYFAIASALRGETWMILGNLMGAVVVPATLVLGIVAIIHPIVITNISLFVVARFFLIISSLFFLFFVRSDRTITKKEGLILLGIYLLFVISELIIR